MANSGYSCVIQVDESYREGGHWGLTSKNLPGLFLAGKDLNELRADVPNVIKVLFKNNYGLTVEVRAVVDSCAVKDGCNIAEHIKPGYWSASPIAA